MFVCEISNNVQRVVVCLTLKVELHFNPELDMGNSDEMTHEHFLQSCLIHIKPYIFEELTVWAL